MAKHFDVKVQDIITNNQMADLVKVKCPTTVQVITNMFTASKYLRTRLPEIINVINSVLPKPDHNVTITQEMEIDSDECNDLEVIQEVLSEKCATPSWADAKDGNSKAEPPVTVKMPSAPVIVSRPAAPYDPNRTCSSCGEIGHFKRN
ncbi:unnamed protein product, partial [Allacma fusca]